MAIMATMEVRASLKWKISARESIWEVGLIGGGSLELENAPKDGGESGKSGGGLEIHWEWAEVAAVLGWKI